MAVKRMKKRRESREGMEKKGIQKYRHMESKERFN